MRKMLIIGIIFVGGLFVFSGFKILKNTFQAAFVDIAPSGEVATNTVVGEEYKEIYDAKYSFAEDEDKDGLSNAWEFILVVSPTQDDTDGDGYSDGDEVKNGFDPNLPGSTKIADNPKYRGNLTIQYLLWSEKNNPGVIPRLETAKVNQFIEETIDTSLDFKPVPESDIVIDGEDTKESILGYFQRLKEVPLPTVTESYFDILKRAVVGDLQPLDKLVNQLVVIRGQLRTIPTPPAAKNVHKKYIGFIDTIAELFGDLYNIERDPVRLSVNLEKGTRLVTLIKDLELSSQEVLRPYSK